MAYFTGTVSTNADIKTLIETKTVLSGWTLTSGWLHKGNSNVKLELPADNIITISGANSSDGTVEPCPLVHAIGFSLFYWPAVYHLFINTNPDLVVFVVVYGTNRIQVMIFGDLKKIHNSAYVGGNFFYASTIPTALTLEVLEDTIPAESGFLSSLTNTDINASDGQDYHKAYSPIPFVSMANGNYQYGNAIHVKIDTRIWDDQGADSYTKVFYTPTTISSLFRSPNLYNSQTHLIPINLQFAMADNLYGYLGYVEHMRLCRIDNYEIADIITISPDQWMVFPWKSKNTIHRNGANIKGQTGTVGFAVRYTP